MYCTVREYKLKPSTDLGELIQKVRDGFVPIISRAHGFAGYTVAANAGLDLITVSFFNDREGAQESVELARDWVAANVASAVEGVPRVTSGEVLASERNGGEAAFGVLRRSHMLPGKRADVLKIMGTKLLPLLKGVPGFVSASVVDAGDDELLVVGAFRDRSASEAGTAKAMPFMQENAFHLMTGPPKMTDAEILVRHVDEAAFAL